LNRLNLHCRTCPFVFIVDQALAILRSILSNPLALNSCSKIDIYLKMIGWS
jgi:hypothetical protein